MVSIPLFTATYSEPLQNIRENGLQMVNFSLLCSTSALIAEVTFSRSFTEGFMFHVLGIEVLDHLVIGQDSWVSLKQRGLGFEE